MNKKPVHEFHIPVMGTSFTIDTPIRVAKYGISSVVSIGDDELDELMREYNCKKFNKNFEPIKKWEDENYRALRIKAYLNLLNEIVSDEFEGVKRSAFEPGSEITKYFDMLPPNSELKAEYDALSKISNSDELKSKQNELRNKIQPGCIDVNIMTKLDRSNYSKKGELLPDEFSDALTGLRGFAESKLKSSVIFSAGFNRRLFAFLPKFDDFFPDKTGELKKKVVLKVSDFRSSLTQAKFFAKKGIWVSEHRIESGLNCGGHAFATDGFLLGPILEEFKQKKESLFKDMLLLCNQALVKLGKEPFKEVPETKITVQGGIGTANEQRFLMDYYGVDGTGWATPFLLVPEATNVDIPTRQLLEKAEEKDLYLSDISPLGVPFNTVRRSPSEINRLKLVEQGTPGSPCPKGHLVSNMEFTKKPICTASKTYQRLKLKQLSEVEMDAEALKKKKQAVYAKTCLCEDLAAGAILQNDIPFKRLASSAVCPGPNLAYFSKSASLREMVDHIYGRINLLNDKRRPNMFIKELQMYIAYFKKEIQKSFPDIPKTRVKYFQEFKQNLSDGIEYYKELIPKFVNESLKVREQMKVDLKDLIIEFDELIAEYRSLFSENLNPVSI